MTSINELSDELENKLIMISNLDPIINYEEYNKIIDEICRFPALLISIYLVKFSSVVIKAMNRQQEGEK